MSPHSIHLVTPEKKKKIKVSNHIPSLSTNLFILHLKLSSLFASIEHLLTLCHSFIAVFVNQFLLISFLNLNLSSLYPLSRVLTFFLL